MSPASSRVAVLVPYWEFWEDSARGDLKANLAEAGAQAVAAIPDVDATTVEVLYSQREAPEVAERIARSSPEAILVVQTMAVPPARTMSVLDALPEIPIVIWGLNRVSGPSEEFDHSDITTEGATVGTSQLMNLVVRRDRPYALHVGRLQDDRVIARVRDSISAAAAARRIATANLARIGDPPEGYDCVTCDMAELSGALGVSVLDLAPAEVAAAFAEAPDDAVATVANEAATSFEIAPDLAGDDEGLGRSLRFAAALERIDDAHAVDAGAINCHLPELRFSPEVGVTPCYALGRETTRGIPWACAGDVLTAVAMLTTKALGAAALYHELERIDYDTDELVIANSGEHDLAWADPGRRPELRHNGWFTSDPICGACACFSAPDGPATLVALTPHPSEDSGFRYVVAEGEFTGRSFPRAGTANAAFRFRSSGAVEGFEAWARSGANHHSSSTPGHLGDRVAQVAGYLGIGFTLVD